MGKRIIVVGLGQMGAVYLKALKKLGINDNEILGVDIDLSKVQTAQKNFSGIKFQQGIIFDDYYDPYTSSEYGVGIDALESVAIVASNTPSHHDVVASFVRHGVPYILCEKPLGINIAAVREIEVALEKANSKVFTAFLMNFSPAVLHLIDKMQDEGLVLTEGSVVWGKNRMGDKRPTPGDLEDESVHGVGILHKLASVNQQIVGIQVGSMITYPKFADPTVQAKAHELDPSFPKEVNASTMALEQICTDRGFVSCVIHSSYLYCRQTRRVSAVLSKMDDFAQPVYSVEVNFDIKTEAGTEDQLTITELVGNKVQQLSFTCDKILEQTKAFILGGTDPRLTDFAQARKAVAFSEAVLLSSQRNGEQVLVQ